MKDILSILLFVALWTLTSCEPLGIEIKTVKGKWKSDKTNGQNLLLNLEDEDIYSSQTILNDSILLSQKQGTWILKKDTLFIYRQNVENNGLHKLHIEQLSMNTMTLKQIKDEDILVFNRVYSNQNLDYDGRFNEVFNLKKGFWWYAWIIVKVIFFIMMCIYLFYLAGRLIENTSKWIHKKIRNNK